MSYKSKLSSFECLNHDHNEHNVKKTKHELDKILPVGVSEQKPKFKRKPISY